MQGYDYFQKKDVVVTTPTKHIAYTANLSWSSNQGIYKVMKVA